MPSRNQCQNIHYIVATGIVFLYRLIRYVLVLSKEHHDICLQISAPNTFQMSQPNMINEIRSYIAHSYDLSKSQNRSPITPAISHQLRFFLSSHPRARVQNYSNRMLGDTGADRTSNVSSAAFDKER